MCVLGRVFLVDFYLAVNLVADDVELVAVHEDRVDAVHLQKKDQ